MAEEIAWLSAVDLLARFRARTLSPVDVTEALLGRIERVQPALNAFQLVDAEGARAAARASAARWGAGAPVGGLDGVPVTIKDNVLMKGFPTRNGSRTVDPSQAWDEDAPCVARLREAGAVILGKTTTPEFGWKALTDGPLFGVTRSPWNLRMSPGGSSGGAAACVAAGIGPIAFGNDGGGSIRIPASYAGLYGLKPTFGRVPHHPQESPFATLVSGGPLARSVTDAALMLNELAKPDARDPYALPPDGRDYRIGLEDGVRGLRIAWSPRLGGAEPDPEVLAHVARAVERLAALGAAVEDVGPVFDPLAPLFTDYWIAGFAHRYRSIPEDKRDSDGPAAPRAGHPGPRGQPRALLRVRGRARPAHRAGERALHALRPARDPDHARDGATRRDGLSLTRVRPLAPRRAVHGAIQPHRPSGRVGAVRRDGRGAARRRADRRRPLRRAARPPRDARARGRRSARMAASADPRDARAPRRRVAPGADATPNHEISVARTG